VPVPSDSPLHDRECRQDRRDSTVTEWLSNDELQSGQMLRMSRYQLDSARLLMDRSKQKKSGLYPVLNKL
jgi:hypothetical protein